MTARLVTALAILACLQFAAVALLYWPEGEVDPETIADTLLPLSRDEIARIGVTNADGDSVMLVRRDGRWMLEADALPAATSVVDRLLDALAGPTGFPVARSESAHERFEVAADRFQRRITFADHSDETYTGEDDATDTATVYLGTSPGMRRVHARRGDSAAIEAIALSTFEVPATVDGWLEPSLLSVDDLTGVRITGQKWIRAGGEWIPDGGARTPDESPPVAALQALVQVLATLQVTGVAEAGYAEDVRSAGPSGDMAPEMTLWQGDQATTLRLAEKQVYSSAFNRWFSLSSYDRDRLAEAMAAITPG